MQTTAIIVWIYGALVLAGGVMGWAKAKSKPSLIAGLVFGLSLICAGFGVWNGARPALVLSEVLAAMLLVVMGIRLVRTRKFMPAGLISAMSAVVLILLLVLR